MEEKAKLRPWRSRFNLGFLVGTIAASMAIALIGLALGQDWIRAGYVPLLLFFGYAGLMTFRQIAGDTGSKWTLVVGGVICAAILCFLGIFTAVVGATLGDFALAAVGASIAVAPPVVLMVYARRSDALTRSPQNANLKGKP